MNGLGVSNHGIIASNYLKKLGMNSRICFLVERPQIARMILLFDSSLGLEAWDPGNIGKQAVLSS